MLDKIFWEKFNKGKVQAWRNDYIDYISLSNKIADIIEKKINDNNKIISIDIDEEEKREKELFIDINNEKKNRIKRDRIRNNPK